MRPRRTLFWMLFLTSVDLLCAPLTAQSRSPLLDVLRVDSSGEAASAVVTPAGGPVTDVRCPIVIIGGGLGGVSAALAATNAGHTVCMTEPTLWIGGQATSQGVSAFDDNKWIDTTGGTASYLELSRRIRLHYATLRRDTSVSAEAAITGSLSNPGGCWVSRLCFEPATAQQVLLEMIQPALQGGKLRLWTHTVPVSVERVGRRLRSVLIYDFAHTRWLRLHGDYFIEASEMGDLLTLSHLPYRIGAESQAETHERNAPQIADPHASQSFTYPFLLETGPSPAQSSIKPPGYDQFLPQYTFVVDYGRGKLLTYGFYDHAAGLPGSFWDYRRSVKAALFRKDAFPSDRSMINWSSNDYCDANLLSQDPLLQANALLHAKQLSLGFAWWIRRAAPRDDQHGHGYGELRIYADAMGSKDGLSQHPYMRESRRIVPIRTIVEEDIAVDFQKGARAQPYSDSVGIGWYPIDIHSCDRKDFVSQTKPYQIPLGALIDRDADNLLAVGKTIGVTHITNGAYRLHPTEWATGEAAGFAIAWAIEHGMSPTQIDGKQTEMRRMQRGLVQRGHPIYWYDDVPVGTPHFAGMQMGGALGWWTPDPNSLDGGMHTEVHGDEAATAIHAEIPTAHSSALRAKETITWADIADTGASIGDRRGIVDRQSFGDWLVSDRH